MNDHQVTIETFYPIESPKAYRIRCSCGYTREAFRDWNTAYIAQERHRNAPQD